MRAGRDLSRMRSVFEAADRGDFELPQAVTEARSVYGRLVEAVSPVEPVNLGRVESELVERLLGEAGKPEPSWPDPSDVIKARRASEAFETWQAAHGMALEQAEERLVKAVVGRGDVIITECLRPAVERCLADARSVSKDFEAVAAFDDKALLAAEPKYRAAALKLDAVSARYIACRDAQARLTVGLQNDLDGVFAEVSNLQLLYGSQWPGRHTGNWSPFPSNGRQRMAFLVREVEPRPAVVTWTAEQRDSAWEKAFGQGRPGGMGAATPGTADLLGRDVTPLQPAHSNRPRPAGL